MLPTHLEHLERLECWSPQRGRKGELWKAWRVLPRCLKLLPASTGVDDEMSRATIPPPQAANVQIPVLRSGPEIRVESIIEPTRTFQSAMDISFQPGRRPTVVYDHRAPTVVSAPLSIAQLSFWHPPGSSFVQVSANWETYRAVASGSAADIAIDLQCNAVIAWINVRPHGKTLSPALPQGPRPRERGSCEEQARTPIDLKGMRPRRLWRLPVNRPPDCHIVCLVF
jgi:hypothetical protein